MSQIDELTYSDYWDNVRSLGECIESEYHEYDQHIHDMIHEYVDSSQWVIYYNKALKTIQYSDSEPKELFKHQDDFWKVITAGAYECLESDVRDWLNRNTDIL